jgi:hypothetical protein
MLSRTCIRDSRAGPSLAATDVLRSSSGGRHTLVTKLYSMHMPHNTHAQTHTSGAPTRPGYALVGHTSIEALAQGLISLPIYLSLPRPARQVLMHSSRMMKPPRAPYPNARRRHMITWVTWLYIFLPRLMRLKGAVLAGELSRHAGHRCWAWLSAARNERRIDI